MDISTAIFNLIFFIIYISLFAGENFGIKCVQEPLNL